MVTLWYHHTILDHHTIPLISCYIRNDKLDRHQCADK